MEAALPGTAASVARTTTAFPSFSSLGRPPSAPPVVTGPAADVDEAAERMAARYLFFACCGFAVGAFFLSQSYKAMLFINCGLAVGRYLGMRDLGFALPPFKLSSRLPFMFGVALTSVVAMWLLVKILL
jgi:hypothetical protein